MGFYSLNGCPGGTRFEGLIGEWYSCCLDVAVKKKTPMNNVFLSKSELSLDAAEKLKNNPHSHHSSSIHCSYYSCYQKLLHVLFKILNYTKQQYDEEFRLFRINQQAGNHEFIMQLFWRKISAKNMDDGRDFKTEFSSLRKLRIDSDYLEIWIEKDKSDLAYTLAESIHKNLRRNF